MTYVEQLYEKLKDRKTTNFHVSWGPEAVNMTAEERAKFLLDLMNGIDDGSIKYEIHEFLPK